MSGVNIQFFITYSELIKLLEELRGTYNLYIGFIIKSDTSFTFNIDVFKSDDLINYQTLFDKSRTVVLSMNELDLNNAERPQSFLESNPNLLSIDIGEQTDSYIKESWMHTLKTLNEETSLKLWQKIGRKIKKETDRGGLLINELNNTQKESKLVRYTKGVLALNKKGNKVFQRNPKLHYLLNLKE